MDKELFRYEQQLVKELARSKGFSWKRIWKAMQLHSIASSIR